MTDIDLMTDNQLWFMGGMAAALWLHLLTRWAVIWYTRRHPRRATYTAPRPGTRHLSMNITNALK